MSRQIFVFGSNEAGRHGKGAALYARQKHGAIYGVGFGLQGQSFAIPTKDHTIKTLPIQSIIPYVDMFMDFVNDKPELHFNITRIGCGLAGYDWDRDIRPLFPATMPSNTTFI
jgi:hypothetical protein